MAATTDVEELYDSMSTRGIVISSGNGLRVHHSSLRGLKSANEDRVAVHECELGIMVAVFDGHYTDELSDYAAKVLPRLLCDRMLRTIAEKRCELSSAVTEALQHGIHDFDVSLIDAVYDCYPEGAQTDWDDGFWDEEYWRLDAISISRETEKFRAARRANVGTTALIAFLDQAKENIWVASLGDSEAVLGRVQDGTVSCTALNELHNVKNPQEVARLQAEHRGEPPVIYDGRTMRQLGITRALGDHQMKVDYKFASKFLSLVHPSPIIGIQFEFWRERGLEHYHPPYISNTPTVQYHALRPGDVIILASDGLRGALENIGVPADELQLTMLALANGSDFAHVPESPLRYLGHDLIACRDGDNVADFVVRNALFGADRAKALAELVTTADAAGRYRDDLSVAVMHI